jgi:lipopolysaccharide export system protein LptC
MSSPTPDVISQKAEQARRRAARSQLIMRGALFVGLAVLGGFITQSLLKPGPVIPVEEAPNEKPQIISGGLSSFSGIDQNSQPFSVKAMQGVQDPVNDTLMHLTTVIGAFVRREGGDVQVTADHAEYEIKNKDLKVSGNVRFEEPGRYVAYLKSAEVNLDKQVIVTKEPVQVETAGASVSADSMETSDDGKVVTLRGNVKARFVTDVGP